MTTSTPTPARIPLPPDLPEPWEETDDPQFFWTQDNMHFPEPLNQIEDMVARTIAIHGLSYGAEYYDFPIRMTPRTFWGYHYMAIVPLPLSHDEHEAMGQRSEEKLGAAMGRLEERWQTEWLPEIREHLDYWEQFDLQGASTAELVEHFDETLRRFRRLWGIHFEIIFPSYLAMSLFDEFYRDLFGSASPFDSYKLLQGFDNKTLETGHGLRRLSRAASSSPPVRAIFEEQAAADVIPALERLPEGQAFLNDLHAYLDEYGQRGTIWGLSSPSLIEDPTPAIKNVKDYISQSDRESDAELESLADERERLVAETREQLQSYPEAVRNQFEFLLRAAQTGIVLSEDHGYWIDFRSMYQVRRVFMEAGRRFADAGAIERADDVFHLSLDEIRQTALQLPRVERRELIAERKAELDRWKGTIPPRAVGTEPPGPPPVNPVTQFLGKFFGGPPQAPVDPRTLKGNPGSPGVARGVARVARSFADASKLEPGEVLVAETTAPPWTPLFGTAVAVVTDTGGILCHCAVVAREYQIPAVVGVGMATAMIRDGQMIEVDGDQGIVRVLD